MEEKLIKKWRIRKLILELLFLIIALIGLIIAIMHLFDMCPIFMLVGLFVLAFGLAVFMDIREYYTFSEYLLKKESKKVR